MRKLLGLILISPVVIFLGYIIYMDSFTQAVLGSIVVLTVMVILTATGLQLLTENTNEK